MNGSLWSHGPSGTRRRNGTRRALLIALAVLGGVALAACGTVRAPASGAGSGHTSAGSAGTSAAAGTGAAQPALCRDAATVTSLVITRDHGFRVLRLRPGFPSQVTVTSTALVRNVARALCALPDMPRGVLFNCPALLPGTAYTLAFTVDGRSLPLVTINTTGCETVTGVGPVRRVTSPGFWRVLSEAIGVRTPPVFGGVLPGQPCQPPSARIVRIDACPGEARPGTGVVDPLGAAAP